MNGAESLVSAAVVGHGAGGGDVLAAAIVEVLGFDDEDTGGAGWECAGEAHGCE